MAGKRKQANTHRKARFQNHPARRTRNAKRRWERCYKKMLRKAEARGVDIDLKFSSYEEELKDNDNRNGKRKSRQ